LSGRSGPVQNFVIFTTAIRTKNKRMIINAKKQRRELEIIHEKGERLNVLSIALRWDGSMRETAVNMPKRRTVRKIWGEGEFMGSFGANVDT